MSQSQALRYTCPLPFSGPLSRHQERQRMRQGLGQSRLSGTLRWTTAFAQTPSFSNVIALPETRRSLIVP
jgi:hypothetical protein